MHLVRSLEPWACTAVAAGCVLFGALESGCVRSVEARTESWWSARTASVHVETDLGAEHARALAQRIERQVHTVRSAFYRCAMDDRQPIEITVLGAADEAYASLREETALGRSLRAFDGLVALPPRIVVTDGALVDGALGARVLSHEIAHRFVDSCFHDAPTWLDEGLATMFETVLADGNRVIVGRARYRITDGTLAWTDAGYGLDVRNVPRLFVPSASALVSMSAGAFWGNGGSLGFGSENDGPALRDGTHAGALALVHYLALGPDPDMRARFVWYLSALSQGTASPEAAFAEAFRGVDLDARVEEYARAESFPVTVRPLAALSTDAPQLASMTTAEAHLRLAELQLSARGPLGEEAARPHLALAAAAPSTLARALLVRASFAEGERASELVRTAERVAPDDRDVLRARILVARAEGERDVATDRAARLARRSDLRAADLVAISEVERADGDLDRALRHAQLAVAADRGAWSAWLAVARAARDGANWRLARGALTIVIHLASHRAPAAAAEARAGIASIDGVPIADDRGEGRLVVAPAAPASYEQLGNEAR